MRAPPRAMSTSRPPIGIWGAQITGVSIGFSLHRHKVAGARVGFHTCRVVSQIRAPKAWIRRCVARRGRGST